MAVLLLILRPTEVNVNGRKDRASIIKRAQTAHRSIGPNSIDIVCVGPIDCSIVQERKRGIEQDRMWFTTESTGSRTTGEDARKI